MRLNCGDTVPKSCSYTVVNEQGEVIGKVYMNEGETFPPTRHEEPRPIFLKHTIKIKNL